LISGEQLRFEMKHKQYQVGISDLNSQLKVLALIDFITNDGEKDMEKGRAKGIQETTQERKVMAW